MLRLKHLGIDTYRECVVYLAQTSPICRAEGWTAQARLQAAFDGRSIIATLNVVTNGLLADDEVALSDVAARLLGARDGDLLRLTHAPQVGSLGLVRAKVYGDRLDQPAMDAVVADIVAGRYSDIELAAFVTAFAGDRADVAETIALTRAMVSTGERLYWGRSPIADKHCVGGLPGNRTSMVVVPIVAACGLTVPKTSSRAITSPAGTADAMETLAPVALDLATMRRVVEREGGCIVWGGAVRLSPADDVIISVERPLDLDTPAQLVASVLSKKIAAGSTHVVVDIPLGPTAKMRTDAAANAISSLFDAVARDAGLSLRIMRTDGTQPVGRGVGPALEARDVLRVLRREPDQPEDLRDRAVTLAGALLELCGAASAGTGVTHAKDALSSGAALSKFEAICAAQGGMRQPPIAAHRYVVTATRLGVIAGFDNRRLARLAKLAGAPRAPAAGVELHVRASTPVVCGQPLFTIHAESPGELEYARSYLAVNSGVVELREA